MHHSSPVPGMAQGYLVIQIDLAHFRAQLIVSLAVTGILEINIGTVLVLNSELKAKD
jgi:hypothetical protein